MKWCIRTQYSDDKTIYPKMKLSEENKKLLCSLLNIALLRRLNEHNYFQNNQEIFEKVEQYINEYGDKIEDCMYYFTVYNFTEKTEKEILNIRNIIGYKIFINEEFRNIFNLMPILYKYLQIITFDIGCSSQALGDLVYILSKILDIDFNTYALLNNLELNIKVSENPNYDKINDNLKNCLYTFTEYKNILSNKEFNDLARIKFIFE